MSNNEIKTPLEHFLGWFSALPMEHQNIIATAAYFMPGFECEMADAMEQQRQSDFFVDRVKSYQDHPARERGAAVVLHFCLEHLAFANQGTGDWREKQANLRELATEIEYEPLHEIAESMQFRQAQWAQTRSKWIALKAGPFSLDAIDAYRPELSTYQS
ncbi:hypothetical protein NTJ56_20825 [Burkholderia contaminans]|uniref:hypothetical protein n=1 Tax=Burkholderia contaminans TaxID=488447 RepID=UPI001CF48A94|nr:hypothetical protein [Burkholderia contaminans]MCA7915715.1 hypothetical protein [Burkholderia contaminans]UUX40882.1 hypothetical protein NTJ56_20825 [Burkholderia contaminans]